MLFLDVTRGENGDFHNSWSSILKPSNGGRIERLVALPFAPLSIKFLVSAFLPPVLDDENEKRNQENRVKYD